jgi:thymidylate synthase
LIANNQLKKQNHQKMKQYLDLIATRYGKRFVKEISTGTGTKKVSLDTKCVSTNEGFPVTTKLHLKSIYMNCFGFKGDTNIKYLQENGVKIWDAWADANGDLGPVYGHQWRNWNSEEIDQISELIKELKPILTAVLVSAWNLQFFRTLQNHLMRMC